MILGFVAFPPTVASAGEGKGGLTSEEETVISVYRSASLGVVHITSTVLSQDFFFRVIPEQ